MACCAKQHAVEFTSSGMQQVNVLMNMMWTSHIPQVPRSSRVITEDSDYALVSVVLFKRVVDEFKGIARQKGYQVRCVSLPPDLGVRRSARRSSYAVSVSAMTFVACVCALGSWGARAVISIPHPGFVMLDSLRSQVREYSAPAEEAQAGGAALETLKRDVDAKKGALEAWCKTAYGEVGADQPSMVELCFT
jgi:hypothetical protein